MEEQRPNQNIYKISRSIKRRDSSLYNALRSIYDDSIFVGEIAQLWPELPLLANLRCGLWYSPNFHSNCYFKSTDGHTNNLSFSTARLNLHVALLAAQRGGCIIVDSTRKGKRFPDSMSKTIPIWTCVLNRAILNYRRRLDRCDYPQNQSGTSNELLNHDQGSSDWDCSLHLPLWVSETEKEMIGKRLEGWDMELEASGADIASIALALRKPLRPLWISHKTVIWLNEVPDYDSWNFTPIILVQASSSSGTFQQQTTSEFSWNYIAGAGDDEESWARGLSPDLFWKHANDIISSGPDLCNQKIANIVEKDRVCRAHRGENAPQVSVRSFKCAGSTSKFPTGESLELDNETLAEGEKSSHNHRLSFLGSTNIAVCKSQIAMEVPPAHCILNCDRESFSVSLRNPEMYLHLPIMDSKLDRLSLLRNLPSALNFAQSQLRKGNALLICCCNGEDISICVCLAIFTSFYDEAGNFDDGRSFSERRITKLELRRRATEYGWDESSHSPGSVLDATMLAPLLVES
ncbi:initiator tRNA phosphoribosyl transferase family protein [Perilla frutescens var. hirtella]|uniref:Initiator tRNA phosphoribosyl transferase family protein n=1 Tax=Perilla frutescens var. hirtella TaxID=608512 RepID=A0AAD4J438_PERFH|nr:initiator tRNA phosphoribosyl transferase family protein [Perilla frutescens var. hirtella]